MQVLWRRLEAAGRPKRAVEAITDQEPGFQFSRKKRKGQDPGHFRSIPLRPVTNLGMTIEARNGSQYCHLLE